MIYRHEKGAPLTTQEIDGNFHELAARLKILEDHPGMGEGIGQVRVQGDHMILIGTFGTDFGTFALPKPTLGFRGAWLPQTPYQKLDFVTRDRGLYSCLQDHTSQEWGRDGPMMWHEMLPPPQVLAPLLLYERATLPPNTLPGTQALFSDERGISLIFFEGKKWQRLVTGDIL